MTNNSGLWWGDDCGYHSEYHPYQCLSSDLSLQAVSLRWWVSMGRVNIQQLQMWGAYVQYTCLCWRKSVMVGIRVQIRSTIKHYEVCKKWLAFWRMMTMWIVCNMHYLRYYLFFSCCILPFFHVNLAHPLPECDPHSIKSCRIAQDPSSSRGLDWVVPSWLTVVLLILSSLLRDILSFLSLLRFFLSLLRISWIYLILFNPYVKLFHMSFVPTITVVMLWHC